MARSSSEKRLLKTGDVLKRSGVSRQMLYNYVALGLVGPDLVRTTPAGHMLFTDRIFNRLSLIQNLQLSGYSLRDMKDIFFERERRRPGDPPEEGEEDGA
jgi:DNA-binding transcriptional MerR regulator